MSSINYVEIHQDEVPEELRWDVPPRNQGQIVTISYADWPAEAGPACRGSEYCRSHDASDGETRYYRRDRRRFGAWAPAVGWCGHRHQSLRAAALCSRRMPGGRVRPEGADGTLGWLDGDEEDEARWYRAGCPRVL